MIPNLALILSAYVITQMLQIIVKQNPKEHGLVVAAAAVTILVTLVAMGSIILTSVDVGKALNDAVPVPLRR